MAKDILIKKTLHTLSRLPKDKVSEVLDFADYILKKHEENALRHGIHKLVMDSETFHFLKTEEEDLYTLEDLKEKF